MHRQMSDAMKKLGKMGKKLKPLLLPKLKLHQLKKLRLKPPEEAAEEATA
jgi:hypothetical protein